MVSDFYKSLTRQQQHELETFILSKNAVPPQNAAAAPPSATTQLRVFRDLTTGETLALDAAGNLIPLHELAGKGISICVGT